MSIELFGFGQDPRHRRVAGKGLDRGRDHPIEVTAGQAYPHVPDIDSEPYPTGQRRRLLRLLTGALAHAF
ncbi:hypothetical protein GCM10023160_22880 [Brachybacterium paraconglomeratum]